MMSRFGLFVLQALYVFPTLRYFVVLSSQLLKHPLNLKLQVKPKHLSSLQIDPPSSSKTLKVGTLKKKHAAFDIWSIGKEITDETPVGGEEINTLSCLLPRSKKGKVYHAPKPIARRLVLSAQPVSPTQAEPQTLPDRDPSTQKYKNPPRPSYPNELLKHAFKPYGSNTTTVNGDTREEEDGSMDVDVNAQTPSTKPSTKTDAKPDPEPKKSKDKEKKGKKRKVASDETTVEEDAAPKKKSKKSKSSS
ncbi:hypothetical protein CC2G_006268 [Coprinopsis cinerea AmutBmut pab1-1]|nr:hypothetical protein CC2G_006268 [Coprinopsis cinerea AmutBmut pab1-1]